MKTTEIEFELEGICPLKMDNAETMSEQQPKNEEGYKKQAENKVYLDEKGNLAIPSVALKAVIKAASSEVGKKMEAKKNRQTIMSAVFIEPNMLTILDINNKPKKTHDGIVKDLVTRGQGAKVTRVQTFRPLVKEWKIKGRINAFSVPVDFIKECIELGGLRYGLLSHRPEFGRYKVNSFVVKK